MHIKKLQGIRRVSRSFKGPVHKEQSIYMIVAALLYCLWNERIRGMADALN